MAEPVQKYQLFPSPVTKVKPNNNPFRNSVSRHGRHFQAVSPIDEEEIKSPDGAQTVVIKITEPVSPIQDPPAAVIAKARSRTPSPVSEPSGRGSPTSMRAIQSPCYPLQNTEKGSPLPSPAFHEKKGPDSTQSHTAAPMRSMFPQYNPSVPLHQQSYFPQGAAIARAPPMAMTRDEYSPRVVSPSPSDALTGGPKTAPSSVIDFPIDDTEYPGRFISSLTDLSLLWKATNGEGLDTPIEAFDLQMSRISPAIFSFGLSSSQPFYTLKCYSTNELGITRYHPARPKKLPVLLLALEDRARRLPPYDGLVSYIFPKLAAMLATSQAAELAQQHGLASTDKDDMTKEAIARAAAQEASQLIWNESEQRYEYSHPALSRSPKESTAQHTRPELSIVTQPNSQQPTAPSNASSTLHITISQPTPSSPPVISIIDPSSPSTSSSSSSTPNPSSTPNLFAQPATLRASTQALHHDPPTQPRSSSSAAALATLSLSTLTLTLHAQRILSLLPSSLYAIDSCVSALLAVAVADERTNPWLDSLPISPSRPPMAPGRRRGGGGAAMSVAGSVATNATGFTGKMYTTLAERMDAEKGKDKEGEEERELMGKIRRFRSGVKFDREREREREPSGRDSDSTLVADANANVNAHSKSSSWRFLSLRNKPSSSTSKTSKAKAKSKPPTKSKKITVTEYDLEKWGTYQAGSRQGEPLPGPARAVVSALFLLLRVFVSVLTAVVEVVAWAVVVGTRAVTSERF